MASRALEENTGDPTVTIESEALSVAATPGDEAPIRTLAIGVINPPANALFVRLAQTAHGIQSVSGGLESGFDGSLRITFKAPATMPDGLYRDRVRIDVCLDAACKRPVQRSPVTVLTSYVITSPGSVTMARNHVEISAPSTQTATPTASVRLRVKQLPTSSVYFSASANTSNGLQFARAESISTFDALVELTFGDPTRLEPGVYEDTVQVSACYDPFCNRHLPGSPLQLRTSYEVVADVAPEPGVAALPFTSRRALAHDVVAAAYSRPLNMIVMAATTPRPALYLYDIAKATEVKLALRKTPTALAMSPDGTQVAVGHDAMVSIVDLVESTQADPPEPARFPLSIPVFDLALDARGTVYAVPGSNWSSELHILDLATKAETVMDDYPTAVAGAHIRLDASGRFLYSAKNADFDETMQKFQVQRRPVSFLYGSSSRSDFSSCGNLWLSANGRALYSACGAVFSVSASPARDLRYRGRLQLSRGSNASFGVVAASESPARGELAVIEEDGQRCSGDPFNSDPCFTHLALFDNRFYQRRAVYSIPPVAVAGARYVQRGLFVFHSATGLSRFVIGRAPDVPAPGAQYYLSVTH